MKLRTVAMVALMLLTVSCKQQPYSARKVVRSKAAGVSSSSPFDTTARNDSLMALLAALQYAISTHPEKRDLIRPFLKASFDSVSSCFSVVGKGTYNSTQPEGSWEKGRKIASSYDGQRWALYCKTWLQGKKAPFGSSIAGQITYSKVVYEKLVNDSLYQLILVPSSSVIIE
jgi:hypothetical protein